jgi:hypothetical protein
MFAWYLCIGLVIGSISSSLGALCGLCSGYWASLAWISSKSLGYVCSRGIYVSGW